MYKDKPGVTSGKLFLLSLSCLLSFLMLAERTHLYAYEFSEQLSAEPEGGFAEPLGTAFSSACPESGGSAATDCWRPTKSLRYNPSGTLLSYLKYRYNATGQLTKTSRYAATDPVNPMSYVTYKYNSKGQLSKVYVYDDTSLEYSGVSKYNIKGQLIEGMAYDDTGALIYYGLCEYDGTGRISKISAYKSDDSLQYVAEMTYNSKNKLTKVSIYDSSHVMKAYFTYNYDTKGRLIKDSLYVNFYIWFQYYYTNYRYVLGPCPGGNQDPLFFWVMLASFLEL